MLGLIVAIGPLSIDMYLPASMAEDFGVVRSHLTHACTPGWYLVNWSGTWRPHQTGKTIYFGMTLYVVASVF